jgi:hypothetical protein
VQSSAMALMAAHGELKPMPSLAIFADTQREPQHVYDWLVRLQSWLPFPVQTVTRGDLGADFLAALRGEQRCGQPPFYVRNPQCRWECGVCAATVSAMLCHNCGNANPAEFAELPPDRGGMLWRQCTKDYKLDPLRRAVRSALDARGAVHAVQWIGISLDEWHRAGRESGVDYITNRYPLIERRLTREQCIEWLQAHGYPEPPKSACYFCPYVGDARWRVLQANYPEEFARAVEYDEQLRQVQRVGSCNGAKINGELFVHRSMRPLRDVVFSTKRQPRKVQPFPDDEPPLFARDCEGMCGV